MQEIPHNLERVRARIAAAASDAGRPADAVRLVAVSKTRGPEAIATAHAAGQTDFGENYLQEALTKIEALSGNDGLVWHFIGPIQSNKTRAIAENFDWVHSVDRLKIARRLSAQRPEGLAPLQLCLQVNVDDQASKSGVSPDAAAELAAAVAELPNLRLRGLMAIPAPADDPADQQRPFAALRRLLASIDAGGCALDTLSMGMTGDLEAAIAEGATLVRVGTAIFGLRP